MTVLPAEMEGAVAKDFFSEPKENSRIKACIVSKYFGAWANIMKMPGNNRSGKLAYIDLFAGPGRYDDGTRSTPLLVLELALKDAHLREKLITVFNDQNPESAGSLREAISGLEGVASLATAPVVHNRIVDDEMAAALEQMRIVPTLFFFDPFGYKGLSLRLINAVLKDYACEGVFFFNFNRINMGIRNSGVRTHMEALFGAERVETLQTELDGYTPEDRELRVVEELTQALRRLGGKFVLPFRFKDEKGSRTSHYLVFVSKHPLGYGIMKNVMATYSSKVEQGVPSFEYCVADERFPTLFELNRPLDALEGMLMEEFAGQVLAMKDIYNRHHVNRPFIESNYKDALRSLEAKDRIGTSPPASKRPRRNGDVTFGPQVTVTFPSRK